MTLESTIRNMIQEDLDKACWQGYKAIGTKKKNGKTVPNCVPEDFGLDEGRMKELHGYIAKGMSAADIAKKMKLDIKTIKALMDGYQNEAWEIGTDEYVEYLQKLTPGELDESQEQIKKLEKMLKDLEKNKKKTPGDGYAKIKIRELIADLKSKKEEVDLDEAPKYDLYHKDFSSAMQHAYKMAKKLHGITVDPKEIDDKVASGPRKPSEGKTNTYRLKGDKGAIQVQVYNKGVSKPYELNFYKEEVELDEKKGSAGASF